MTPFTLPWSLIIKTVALNRLTGLLVGVGAKTSGVGGKQIDLLLGNLSLFLLPSSCTYWKSNEDSTRINSSNVVIIKGPRSDFL